MQFNAIMNMGKFVHAFSFILCPIRLSAIFYIIRFCSAEIGKNCEWETHSAIPFESLVYIAVCEPPLIASSFVIDIQILRHVIDIQFCMWHDGQKSRCAICVFRWMRYSCLWIGIDFVNIVWRRFLWTRRKSDRRHKKCTIKFIELWESN